MALLKGNQSDDLTLKYLLQNASGGGIADVTVDGTSVVTDGIAAVDLTGKSNVGHTHVKTDITDFPTIPVYTIAFTATLASASWSSNAQTISDAKFLASGYAYIVSPASGSFVNYSKAAIYADDVSTDGSMTFHCTTTPTSDLTVNIVRVVA